jgi:DNA-directed RNA polymerase subunit RPC12/RpoP
MAEYCPNCDTVTVQMDLNDWPVSSHAFTRVSSKGQYRCQKCSWRFGCKLRKPDKFEDNYEERRDCEEFSPDKRWWK